MIRENAASQRYLAEKLQQKIRSTQNLQIAKVGYLAEIRDSSLQAAISKTSANQRDNSMSTLFEQILVTFAEYIYLFCKITQHERRIIYAYTTRGNFSLNNAIPYITKTTKLNT